MTKKIYMDKYDGHVNQQVAKLVINKQPSIGDKNNFCKYKNIYLMSKA